MEATLIYNENAGSGKRGRAEAVLGWLREAGFAPRHRPTASESDLDAALAEPGELVVVVGGDGSVRAVAKRLLGRGVPLAIVPGGTANNIGRTLGLPSDPQAVIRGLAAPRVARFDVGAVRAPWGDDIFLEAFGVGLFADVLLEYDPELGKSVTRALGTLREVVRDYQPKRYRIKLDGQEISGTFLAVEVLNTKATGPRLQLAPAADPFDGVFEVVCLLEPTSPAASYLLNLLRGTLPSMERVETLRGTKLELHWQGAPLHLDADVQPTARQRPAAARALQAGAALITLELLPGALELWLPSKATEG